MRAMPFETITVQGFTSIRDAHVDLTAFNVLVGANGSGKSNFINVLELLGRIVDERLQVFVGTAGGASALLHQPAADKIAITLSWHDMFTAGVEARDGYHVVLAPTRDDRMIFQSEAIYSEQLLRTSPGAWESHPQGTEHGSGHFETMLHRASEQSGLAQYVINKLRGCRVYHFHDTSHTAAVKQPGPTGDNLALHADAGNLAAVLRVLREGSPATYRQIIGTIRLVAPFFDEFVLEPEHATDTVRLRWRHAGSDRVLSAHQLSDGTLRFMSLATLLLDTNRLPALVVLDEPELGLHPFAIVRLAEMLRAASSTGQVVVATQSVTLIDQMDLSDLIVVEREHGSSTFRRPEPDALHEWLAEYSAGELWQKSLIGGRPTREAH